MEFVENNAEGRVESKRRLQDLQKLCRAERSKIPESVCETIALAVVLVDDTVVITSPGAAGVADQRADEFMRQLASTAETSISLAAKLYSLKRVRDMAKLWYGEYLNNVQAEGKTLGEYT